MPRYEIIRVTRRYAGRARITHERTITTKATLADVIALAEKQGADVDEVVNELADLGITSFPGYMISEYPF